MDERAAVAQLRAGDIGGLEPLVRSWYLPALRAAYLVTHDRALAEDVVQSAFIRAYERIDAFDPGRPFGPWFLKVVVNSATRQATRLGRQVSLEAFSGDGPSAELPDASPHPHELIEAAETRDEVWAALDRLPPEQRAAVVLTYYLELPDAIAAARVGTPHSTLRWRLYAARKRLRSLLASDAGKTDGDGGRTQ